MTRLGRLAAALLFWLPGAAAAQGTAPAQGVTQPMEQPSPAADPPAPKPADVSDGRARPDPGGAQTRTTPDTTTSLPLPEKGQADPPKMP